MAKFISATTTHARSDPPCHSSSAQYRHAAIINPINPAATTLPVWPTIAACNPAEPTASAAHARRAVVRADIT
jgi:hypothetical protein